jgi:DNA-binding PadR family transcriptional regulator
MEDEVMNCIETRFPLERSIWLILKTLARSGEMHGYEIANSIQWMSEDVLQVEEGSLYPALQRMLIKGWVTAEWHNGRRSPRSLLPTHRPGTQTTRN